MVERGGSSDPEQLVPFEGIDVEADVAQFGPAPKGRSLTDAERLEVARQMARRDGPGAEEG
ncbi:MAG: hypothetical protein ACJ71T_07585 [Actinomycetales bacterium]|jgi:hypothetical protein